jgi:hypothetical protein
MNRGRNWSRSDLARREEMGRPPMSLMGQKCPKRLRLPAGKSTTSTWAGSAIKGPSRSSRPSVLPGGVTPGSCPTTSRPLITVAAYGRCAMRHGKNLGFQPLAL